jgi:hypothetical protein
MDIVINGNLYRKAFVFVLGERDNAGADIYVNGNDLSDAPPRFHTHETDGVRHTWNSAERLSPADYDRLLAMDSRDIG